MLRFTHFLEMFEQKKCLFGSKTVFFGQEVHYYLVYIAYFTELILQICDYAQKRRIWREKCKYALDDNLHCHFCSRRKAAKFCHPEYRCVAQFRKSSIESCKFAFVPYSVSKRHWQLILGKLGFYFSYGITLDIDVVLFWPTSYWSIEDKTYKKVERNPL